MTVQPESGREQAWHRVGAAADFQPGDLHTVKLESHQLVVGRTQGGCWFALDNRCPHEGYPLAQGSLDGEQLTCRWHNWKFQVGDGRCNLGGEDVRSYPTRQVEGDLEVGLASPDPTKEIERLAASLDAGLRDADLGRCLRDTVRLLGLGVAPAQVLAQLAAHDAVHAEYGSSHVLAVAADALRYLATYPGVAAVTPIARVIELCIESDESGPVTGTVPAIPGGDCDALTAAIEAEDEATARGLVAGAFADGLEWRAVMPWLIRAAARHFTDFGHQLIYADKLEELLPAAEGAHAQAILDGLVRSLVYATREDLLPYFAGHRRRWQAVEGELEEVASRPREGGAFDADLLVRAVVDGTAAEAFDAVWGGLRDGVAADRIGDGLVLAGAEVLLGFDADHDANPEVAENWLWASHRFTFAAAVRATVARHPGPDALRLLLQAAGFIQTGQSMLLPQAQRSGTRAGHFASGGSAELAAALRARDQPRAMAMVLARLVGGAPVEDLYGELAEAALRTELVRPIFVAHAIKTTLAAIEEHRRLTAYRDRDRILLAATRLLTATIRENRTLEAASSAVRWVADGVMPRKLTQ